MVWPVLPPLLKKPGYSFLTRTMRGGGAFWEPPPVPRGGQGVSPGSKEGAGFLGAAPGFEGGGFFWALPPVPRGAGFLGAAPGFEEVACYA